ncbi:MAG TPA: preprotein translocase subunit SecG [Spirochaetota bacterium]|nr:preprotein translocase subunit SecG [Spirochaetota bacterium]HOM39128.1 preprotein translocase subunit SecG [Spirochaetota bacterium]HPQ50011.1 preprotein translocase subunit SecG [Spirochaetota bacterium]
MGFIITLLYVFITISAILLILLVLVQSNKGSDLGLFGGSADMVFGSQKGNVLTRTTAVLMTIIMIGTFSISIIKSRFLRERLEVKKEETKIKTLEDIEKPAEENK